MCDWRTDVFWWNAVECDFEQHTHTCVRTARMEWMQMQCAHRTCDFKSIASKSECFCSHVIHRHNGRWRAMGGGGKGTELTWLNENHHQWPPNNGRMLQWSERTSSSFTLFSHSMNGQRSRDVQCCAIDQHYSICMYISVFIIFCLKSFSLSARQPKLVVVCLWRDRPVQVSAAKSIIIHLNPWEGDTNVIASHVMSSWMMEPLIHHTENKMEHGSSMQLKRTKTVSRDCVLHACWRCLSSSSNDMSN